MMGGFNLQHRMTYLEKMTLPRTQCKKILQCGGAEWWEGEKNVVPIPEVGTCSCTDNTTIFIEVYWHLEVI